MKKNRGIILVSVLMVLMIMAVMAISMMKASVLETKMQANVFAYTQAIHTAEAGMRVAESMVVSQQINCLKAANSANYYAQLNNWNLLPVCSGQFDNMTYQFIIEKLPVTPCLYVKDKISIKQAQVFRMTVRGEDQSRQSQRYIQETFVVPLVATKMNCRQKKLLVNFGRQSWREIY